MWKYWISRDRNNRCGIHYVREVTKVELDTLQNQANVILVISSRKHDIDLFRVSLRSFLDSIFCKFRLFDIGTLSSPPAL